MGNITKYQEAVGIIKNAILRSRYQSARFANREQLQLYYDIGKYVSDNTRSGKWGTGAIEEISRQLQLELPGLRGYSASNIKYMRAFFEEWSGILGVNRQLTTGDSQGVGNGSIRQLTTGELEMLGTDEKHQVTSDDFEPPAIDAFFSVGFTHHIEILSKCKSTEERWYYIKRCASEFWSVEALKAHIRANDYAHMGALPTLFAGQDVAAKQTGAVD